MAVCRDEVVVGGEEVNDAEGNQDIEYRSSVPTLLLPAGCLAVMVTQWGSHVVLVDCLHLSPSRSLLSSVDACFTYIDILMILPTLSERMGSVSICKSYEMNIVLSS